MTLGVEGNFLVYFSHIYRLLDSQAYAKMLSKMLV
jgi:hypothetical protein